MNLPVQRFNTPSPVAGRQVSFQHVGMENLVLLKRGIWVYFLLLIFEGALRKWVFPGLSSALLVVRDPVAIWLLIKANRSKFIVFNQYLLGFTVITIFAIITALLLGHGNLFVAIYGARIYLIHFPLIFVIGRVFNYEDVLKMGRVILYISLPMTVLMTLQFYSPQSAWVNRGVGGDMAGGGFDGALGFFRPPTTFSFISGTVSFYGMVASFILFFWLNPKYIKKWVLILSSICLLAAVPLSISRSVFFEVVLSMLFALIVISRKPKNLGKIIPIVIFSMMALAILSRLEMFQTATEAFTSRFDVANENEGGLQGVFLDRFLGGMISALNGSSNIPFFGYGIGMGTNAGSLMLSGKVDFLIAEVEWGRLIGEMGAVLGIGAILLRVGLVFKMLTKSYKKMTKDDPLPWMLLSYCLMAVLQGQWAQPTILGFAVIGAGLVAASLKVNPNVTVL